MTDFLLLGVSRATRKCILQEIGDQLLQETGFALCLEDGTPLIDRLLVETGDYLLQEISDRIVLE